jgi:hypothetical protein
MKLVRDLESFAEPIDQAIRDAVRAVIAAGKPVRGSEKRVRVALDEKNDLARFVTRTGELLESRGFANLPRLRRGSQVVPSCHQLTVGPWRGVFLVDPAGELVVGLLFSKQPHQLDDRLEELVLKYAPTDEGSP